MLPKLLWLYGSILLFMPVIFPQSVTLQPSFSPCTLCAILLYRPTQLASNALLARLLASLLAGRLPSTPSFFNVLLLFSHSLVLDMLPLQSASSGFVQL